MARYRTKPIIIKAMGVEEDSDNDLMVTPEFHSEDLAEA